MDNWFPWNGSKRWLLNDMWITFKKWDGQGRYIEPFVGGGCVSRLVKELFPATSQIISDANPWLISAFQQQALSGPKISDKYLEIDYWRGLNDSDLSSLSTLDKANRFAICLLTAWGNRCETIKDGTFRSTVNKKYCEPTYLQSRLEKFFQPKWLTLYDNITACDWKESVYQAEPGDLVYFDPPYPESLGYGNNWWSFSDLLDIVDWCEQAIHRGINVIVSNMATIERLYRHIGMEIKLIEGPKSSQTRRDRKEVLAWYINNESK